ncbi:MAG TPA: alpha/beta fold hydrolase [Microlunatus sp.]|nr:alpha/beta fold hydrolase [Microlunatus sp.]
MSGEAHSKVPGTAHAGGRSRRGFADAAGRGGQPSGGPAADLASGFAQFDHDYPYRELVVAGRHWRYRAGGRPSGPAVLALAGGTLVPDPLFGVITALGERYRVLAPAYPDIKSMAELIRGVRAVLDAEQVTSVHVVGSSFGGYIAQCLAHAYPARVSSLVLAQTGVRHFVGPAALTGLHALLQLTPSGFVRSVIWRTWQALLTDLGPDQAFWTALLRRVLDSELSKQQLLGMIAATADFTAHYRPQPGDLSGWPRPVLVLQSESDRAFHRQDEEMAAAYAGAQFVTIHGAGHGAVFTHTAEYVGHILAFLAAASSTSPGGQIGQNPEEGATPDAIETAQRPRGHLPLRFDLSTTVRRPTSLLFALLADVQNWVPVDAGIRMIKHPIGETEIGSWWREDVRLGPGVWMTVISRVTAMEPPHRLELDFSSGWFFGHLTYSLSTADAGTVLRQQESLTLRPLLRPARSLVNRTLARRLAQRLDDIRAMLETAQTDSDAAKESSTAVQ